MEAEKKILSELAIASLVMGILSFVNLFSLEKPLAAIVFGALAFKKIEKNASLKGKKLAIAGISLGIIAFTLITVLTIKYFPQLKQLIEKSM